MKILYLFAINNLIEEMCIFNSIIKLNEKQISTFSRNPIQKLTKSPFLPVFTCWCMHACMHTSMVHIYAESNKRQSTMDLHYAEPRWFMQLDKLFIETIHGRLLLGTLIISNGLIRNPFLTSILITRTLSWEIIMVTFIDFPLPCRDFPLLSTHSCLFGWGMAASTLEIEEDNNSGLQIQQSINSMSCQQSIEQVACMQQTRDPPWRTSLPLLVEWRPFLCGMLAPKFWNTILWVYFVFFSRICLRNVFVDILNLIWCKE